MRSFVLVPGAGDLQRGGNWSRGEETPSPAGSAQAPGVGLSPEKLAAPAGGGYLLRMVEVALFCPCRRETIDLFIGPSALNSFKEPEKA